MIRKSSKQRDMILNYMKQIDGHVTPEQVFQEMNAGGQKISLATIYRNLNILCEMHEVKKIAHPIDGYQYDKLVNRTITCTVLSATASLIWIFLILSHSTRKCQNRLDFQSRHTI